MFVIENNVIPFSGFLAVNIFGMVFVRKPYWAALNDAEKEKILRHEAIHSAQGRELLWIGFYFAYFFEWLVRLFVDGRLAYERVSFEREAYGNDRNENYKRKHFAQWR